MELKSFKLANRNTIRRRTCQSTLFPGKTDEYSYYEKNGKVYGEARVWQNTASRSSGHPLIVLPVTLTPKLSTQTVTFNNVTDIEYDN